MSVVEDEELPDDVQEAVYKLIEMCREKDVKIPKDLGKSLLNVLSTSKKRRDSIVLFSQQLKNDREIVKQEILENSKKQQMQELYDKLKTTSPNISIMVKDGYFKFTEKCYDRCDEKEAGKQNIVTVFNGAPIQTMWEKLARLTVSRNGAESKTIERYPMKNVNLFFQQGKTYLVLGGPRSGKSTLLKMLAGMLPEDKFHEVGGTVQFNKVTPKSKDVVWSNVVSYIDQIDRLHPYLTVKETCEFAWRCCTGGTHKSPFHGTGPEIDAEIEKMDKDLHAVMAVLDAVGLTRVKDTFVGDQETVRGVSGGEKKRVTVSEMAVGGFPVACMDEISTGLDAATTYDICKVITEVTSIYKRIKIVSLLQPPPETFALFDELVLLSAGKVIYSGPVEEVVPYFESLGYELPERMDPADWLQALPTKDGVDYLKGGRTTGESDIEAPEPSHLTPDQFHEKFYGSELGKKILEELEKPVDKNKNAHLENLDAIRKWFGSRFRSTSYESLKLLVKRECLLWWRDKAGIKTRIGMDLIMGIIAGTLFWQGWEEVTSVVGILFQSMLFIAMGAMMKVPPLYATRGILYKHQDANFFPTWTYIFGRSLAGVPSSIIDGLLYGTVIYWFVGLAHSDGASFGNYVMFVLITMLSSIAIGLLFSIMPAVTIDKSTGQAYMALAMVLFVLFSGFTVQPSVIPSYWIWLYWINVFAWAYRGLMVNEYASGKYSEPYGNEGDTKGEVILKQMGFVDHNGEAYTYEWAWYSLLFSILISIVSVIISSVLYNNVRFATGKSLSNDAVEEKEDENTTTERVEAEIPFQKVDLTFRDIHYTVTSSITKEKIELLKGVDGIIEAGKMTALMGSSGAGKTTLMDVLSLRKTSGEIDGDVRLNGHLQEDQSFRRCTGYVEQFDVQTAALTIRETCEFSAKLRLESTDPAVTKESTAKLIDQTLDMLELTPIQNFQVGSDDTGGLSFEQKKRLSIAVELVANPSILFLDEPTSGLDARAAAVIMRGLKRISLTGRAVCATIHQPSITIFNSFDVLLLLKRGGEVVFYGDLGEESSNLIQYLQSYEDTPLIQPGENPATWMLTTIGAGSKGTTNQLNYADAYKSSPLHDDCMDKIDKIEKAVSEDRLISFPSKFATSERTQFIEVFKHAMTVYWRSPSYNRTRIMISIALALLIGSVFVSSRVPTTESDMNSRVTTIYMSFTIIAIFGSNSVLAFFEAERNMYYRHKAALMYDTTAIALAFTLAEIPFLVGSCLLYTTIFYFMIGFAAEADKFFLFYSIMLLAMSIFTYLGHMWVSLTPNAIVAQGLSSLFMGVTGLFTGVLIRPENIPAFWKFMYWVMPGHYVLESLLVTQYHNDDTQIEASYESPFYNKLGCKPGVVCTGSAEDWVDYTFGGIFTIDNLGGDFAYLMGLLVLTRVVTFLALSYLNYRRT
eukprot:CAMPEP_0194202806 /NCGR_PEP_ID=MMETSP0156-20130528/2735_1 /TAXON_ID=33649 /ORGANISM="Thalassionema nitzschioides, Strain L26-B" /LENGTH=1424 /DNA_ID=CAMNT_0038928407 /DNA_START=109 /DNA_END=4383 /DNA_ORIENTATION=+